MLDFIIFFLLFGSPTFLSIVVLSIIYFSFKQEQKKRVREFDKLKNEISNWLTEARSSYKELVNETHNISNLSKEQTVNTNQKNYFVASDKIQTLTLDRLNCGDKAPKQSFVPDHNNFR